MIPQSGHAPTNAVSPEAAQAVRRGQVDNATLRYDWRISQVSAPGVESVIDHVVELKTMRLVSLRLLPFLFLLFIFNWLFRFKCG